MERPVELLTARVDLPGLMKVLGRNLYSTPSVAIRELVQNAHDSCVRRQLEHDGAFEPSIVVTPDPVRGTLTIEDTGAGLTRDEIIRDLATVGAGYTGRMRDAGAEGTARLIGQFGLGFLSAFFVSERVELFTTSYQAPDDGWRFASRGGERFQLEPISPGDVGTRVCLHLEAGFRVLAEPGVSEELLRRYCSLLPLPVSLGHVDGPPDPPINRPSPPWRQPQLSPLRRKKLELELAARFEPHFEPIATIPLGGEGGAANDADDTDDAGARGVLWIQGGATYGTSDHRNVSVFVRGMLVSGRARSLLPSWAGFCGALVESDHLTPTASREDLQEDAVFEATAAQIRESLIEGVARLPRTSPAAWRRILSRHNEALLGAALCDSRLFDLLVDELKIPTTEGDLTLPAIRRRSGGRVHVTLGERGGYEEVLFRALQVPVVIGTRFAALPFCELDAERRGGEVVRLGTRNGDADLFPLEAVSAQTLEALESMLGAPDQAVVPTRFEPASLPVVLVPDREVETKRRIESDDADRRIGSAVLGLARRYTAEIDGAVRARLYVNLASPVIQRLLTVDTPRRNAAARVVRAFADLLTDRAPDGPAADAAASLEALSDSILILLDA